MLAGLLSLVSISAQAQEIQDNGSSRVIVDKVLTVDGIHDVKTTEDNARGGAIQNANGFDLTVKGTIEKNTLTAQSKGQISLGGAIFQQGGTLTVEDGTTFNGNTANGYQQSYSDYPQDDYPAGGAIYMTGANAVFTANGEVNFTDNKTVSNSESKYSTGGAIHFESIKSATFNQANFSNNQSGAMGGAIYDGNTDLKFNQVTFENNQSGMGGAIYMLEYQPGTDAEVDPVEWQSDKVTTKVSTGDNAQFTGNTAKWNGGAIANFDGKLTVGQNSTFSGNKAGTDGSEDDGMGGAIYNAKWVGTPEVVIKGGTRFENNSATEKGGAIYNAGKLVLDTTAGDITFSGNTAKEGADIYLAEGSTLTIQDNDEHFSGHKVNFESDNSLAGSGKVTNKGIVHFKGKDPIKDFTGEFVQEGKHAKTILDDTSTSFKMDIEDGELDVSNGANVTLDGENVKFNGDTLSVGNVLQEEESKDATLKIGSDSKSVEIGKNVTVNVENNGEIDIVNGKLTLDDKDKWEGGTIKLASQEGATSALVVDGFTTESGQTYIQEGGSLTLQNNADVEISGQTSVVSGGTVDIEQGSTFSVSNQADIKQDAEVDVKGTLNLKDGGTISGGKFNVSNPESAIAIRSAGISPIGIAVGGTVNVNGGTLSGGTWDFNNNAKLNVTNNGTINGGTYNFNDSSKGDFNGTVSGTSKFNLKDQSEFDIKGGTFGGEIVLGEGEGEQTGSPKLTVEKEATLSGKLDAKKGSQTDVSGTLTGRVDLKGNLNVKEGGQFKSSQSFIGPGGTLTVESGGAISGGITQLNSGDSKLDVQQGGNINGNAQLTVNRGGTLNVDGTVNTTGKVDLQAGSNTTVGQNGSLTLNHESKMNGNVTNKGNVTLDNYLGSEPSTGSYTQDGDNAKLDLKNNSSFELGGSGEENNSSITKGSVTVEGGSSLTVKDNGSIGGEKGTDDNVKVDVKGGSSLTVQGKGEIKNSDITVEGDKSGENEEGKQSSKLEVKDGGKVSGGKVDVKQGGELVVGEGGEVKDSNITADNGKITVKDGEGGKTKSGGKISGGNITAKNGSTLDVQKGGTIENGKIEVESSTFTVEEGGKVTGGEITLGEGSNFSMEEGSDVSGGKFHFEGKMEGDIEIKGEIGEEAEYNFEGGNTFVIKDGGNVTTTNDDKANLWDDDTTIQLGQAETEETKQKRSAEGVSDPTLDWKGNKQSEGHNEHGNGIFKGVKGKLTVEAKDQTFNVWGSEDDSKGFINEDVQVDLKEGSSIDVQENGEVTLNGNGEIKSRALAASNDTTDTWEGEIKVSGGKLTVNNMKKNEKGKYTQTGGELVVKNSFDMNNDEDSITEGKVTIDSDGNKATLKQSKGRIDRKADIHIGSQGKLELSGGTTELDGKDEWEGTVLVEDNGNLTLSNVGGSTSQAKSGKLRQKGGNITVRGTFDMNNDNDSIEGGKFNIGNKNKAGIVNQSKGKIKKNAEVTIEENSELNITGGSTVLNGNGKEAVNTLEESGSSGIDTWKGKITLSDKGKLTLDSIVNPDERSSESDKNHGHLEAKDGELIIKGSSDITFNEEDSVDSAVKFTLKKGSSITIDGGEVTFDTVGDSSENATAEKQTLSEDSTGDGDTWGGDVTLKDGKLTYGLQKNGNLFAESGELETKTDSKLVINSDSYIEDDVKANIQGKLVIKGSSNGGGDDDDSDVEKKGGTVTLGSGDSITGDISIKEYGHLNVSDGVSFKTGSEGTESNNNQKISISENGELDLNGNEHLSLEANINGKGKINKNGNGDIDFKGKTHNFTGDLTVNNSGTLDFYDSEGLGGHLKFGDDIEGKDITIKSDKIMGKTTLDKKATITFETHTDGNEMVLGNGQSGEDNGDDVSVSDGGTLNFNAGSGKLTFKHKVKASKSESGQEGGHIGAYGSKVTFESSVEAKDESSITVGSSEQVSFKNVDLEHSTLNVAGGGFKAESFNFKDESTVNVMDWNLTDNDFGKVSFGTQPAVKAAAENTDKDKANTAIDIAPRQWKSDTFSVKANDTNTVETEAAIGAATEQMLQNGYFNVSDFQFIGKAPIDRHIYLRIFKGVVNEDSETDKQFGDEVTFDATDKTVFSPIGYYGLNSLGDGVYDAYLARYNNQVFRGQVATVANWQNQLTIDNMLFGHMQEINMQYLTQENPNRYAAAFPQFAPYQYNKREGSLWFKPFGNFENLSLGRGIKAENNFYGALVGADFPAIELKRGWTFMPSAYIGYTGAHQNFSHVGMTQNGGQGGVMGSFMHKDFIGTVLAYGGGYGNEMDVTGLYNYAGSYNDKNGNWYVGAATKAAYNFHPSKHFIVQPNFLAAWNLSGEQRWHTNYGDMNMNTGMFNGVAVAPGLNLIYGRETWSMYFTIQYFYNVMSSVNGRAGNVNLPSIGMRHGFLEYGVGATKTWKDRLSGYLQFVVRNVGRTGVGFQGGLMYKL